MSPSFLAGLENFRTLAALRRYALLESTLVPIGTNVNFYGLREGQTRPLTFSAAEV